MNFWQWLGRGPSKKYDTLDLFREVYGGRPASSGVNVTWHRALEHSTMLACTKVVAEGVAQVPWKLYQETGEDIAKANISHPLYPLIYRRPNRWQTSFEFRETLVFHLMLTGNAYVYKGMVGQAREIRELVPLEPQFTTIKRANDGRLTYTYAPTNATPVVFDADVIWHIRGPSWNTWLGMDTTKLLREAIGLAISLESAQSEFQKSGARVSGAYAVDGQLTPERYNLLSTWLDKYAMGGDRAGKPLILDMNAKWLSQQMTGVDAQQLETRRHQIEEICGGVRVMPIMIGFSDKASTYASSEQMFIAHVVHTLSPWYERIEHSADVNLLSDADIAAGFYTKFTPNALMRGAAKDRAEFYSRALGAGGSPAWMTPNDVRKLEEMTRSDDPHADELFWPPGSTQAAQPQGAP